MEENEAAEEKERRKFVWKNSKIGVTIYGVAFFLMASVSLYVPFFLLAIAIYLWYSHIIVGAPISIRVDKTMGEAMTPQARDFLEEKKILQLERDSSSSSSSSSSSRPLAAVVRHNISVMIATWNVGDAEPRKDDLPQWINTQLKYGVIVVGSQECHFKHEKKYDSCGESWWALLTEVLGSNYQLVAAHSVRDSIRMGVFVRNAFLPFLSDIRVGHLVSNLPIGFRKGCVCIGLKIYDTGMCFYNCHLSAHQGEKYVRARAVDSFQILNGVRLGNPTLETYMAYPHTFFFGDLNYRIDLPREEAVQCVSNQNWDKLRENDQLVKEQQKGHALQIFNDQPTHFRPTFKFKKIPSDQIMMGSTREYGESRIPSWCDRILYSSFPGYKIQCNNFTSCETLSTSDHAPIVAAFDVDVKHFKPIDEKTHGEDFVPHVFSIELENVQVTLKGVSVEEENSILSQLRAQSPANSLCYLRLLSEMTEEKVVRSPRVRGSNVWCFPLVPPMTTFPFSVTSLQQQVFSVVVTNTSSSLSSDFCVGQGLIPLSDYSLSDGAMIPFRTPLYLGGIEQGLLTGTLVINHNQVEGE